MSSKNNHLLESDPTFRADFGQLVYSWRSKSVEPLFEQIKDVFGIDPLPVTGFDKAKTSVLLSVLPYQVMVYYNHLTASWLWTPVSAQSSPS